MLLIGAFFAGKRCENLNKYIINKEEAKREQARIEAEILNFEQDLWEY